MLKDLHEGFLQFLTTLGLIALVVIVIYFFEQRRKKKVQSDRDYALFMLKHGQKREAKSEETNNEKS